LLQSIIEAERTARRWFPKGAWKQWVPALIWIAIITIESTDLLSSEHTSNLLYAFATSVLGPVSPLVFELWHQLLRKAGHFVGFFVLSYLLFRAWRATLPLRGTGPWSLPWARVSLLTSMMVATLDEWHQSTIPSRTGNFPDVLLDSGAALVAQIVLWLLLRNRKTPGVQPTFNELTNS
jgi:VanZ family protein